MNRIIKYTSFLIPSSSGRKKFRNRFKSKKEIPPQEGKRLPFKESKLAHHFLDGLNGIEIGASTQNSFGLHRTGAYANIDFDYTQGAKWQSDEHAPTIVNIVANGDDLPFKDSTLDYVLSSHVIEHFFDPIGALKEWLRVVKPGGLIFVICPHIDRTFDKSRKLTGLEELIARHAGKYAISDYAENKSYLAELPNKGYLADVDTSITIGGEPHILIHNEAIPEGFEKYISDDHHHWTTWRTETFVEMCEHLGLNIIESHDKDDKVGNGFTIVIKAV